MKRRLLPILLALTLTLPFPAASAAEIATGFTDVSPEDWFAPYVAVCVEEGLMVPLAEDRFGPEALFSDEDALKALLRLHILCRGEKPLQQAPKDWGYVTLTLQDGTVLEGYADGPVRAGEISWTEGVWVWSQASGYSDDTVSRLVRAVPRNWQHRDWAEALSGQDATLQFNGNRCKGQFDFDPERMVFHFTPSGKHDEALQQAFYYTAGPDNPCRDEIYALSLLEDKEREAFSPYFSSIGEDWKPYHTRRYLANAIHTALGEAPAINRIQHLEEADLGADLPTTPAVYTLYNAGVMTGTDEYGTLDGELTPTRAEAAALLARALRPELRVAFTPSPLPRWDYTLTEIDLGDWVCYDTTDPISSGWLFLRKNVVSNNVYGGGAYGFYRPDGTILTMEEGCDPSREEFSLLWAQRDPRYVQVQRTDQETWEESYTLFDVEKGEYLFPFRSDQSVWADMLLARGLPVPAEEEESGLYGYRDGDGWAISPRFAYAHEFMEGYAKIEFMDGSGIIDAQGAILWESHDPLGTLENLGGGLFFYKLHAPNRCLLLNMNTGETLRRDLPMGGNAVAGAPGFGLIPIYDRYYDLHFLPVTETFQWVGPIGEDGGGFVGKDGKIYRIQFGPRKEA